MFGWGWCTRRMEDVATPRKKLRTLAHTFAAIDTFPPCVALEAALLLVAGKVPDLEALVVGGGDELGVGGGEGDGGHLPLVRADFVTMGFGGMGVLGRGWFVGWLGGSSVGWVVRPAGLEWPPFPHIHTNAPPKNAL